MADVSEFVSEAMEALHTLELGRSNGLSPFLFQKAFEALGPGNPQICGPLKRALVNQDDGNIRVRVLEMIAETGRGWANQFGAVLADEVVLSIADSNLLCAAYACRAVQSWEPNEGVSTPLLLWAKRHLPGLWEAQAVQAAEIPSVQKMIQELPSYAANLEIRRELHNSTQSLENNVRLYGKFKGMLKSAFSKGS